ncbi:ABC-type bacteriocin/lantibiotic exporter with double-glycine peptidase domain [Rheinheimera pacifica]|uniref:cysteine peptidase family C39 domain-containing protein n=1 Tax=Rheinheimera pacifica TaxID=173990 RepID=UPI00286465EA|nr:cysteine peptidase family C39 domain-containing protein [Rheinheimera pacifica]MDR6985061.1 ABC-type bacteriocin/lantibiotic exporter with double-glycine peptidase domain [Rheinheimera pacifica]
MAFFDYIQFRSQRLPVYLQSELAECGIICVAMLACFYGFKINMSAMRQKYPVGSNGLTVKQIAQIAAELGMSARVLKLELSQLMQVKRPVILHWNLNHFITLAKVSSKGVVIHDPAKGQRSLSWQQVAESFTGIAIELFPAANCERKEQQQLVPQRRLSDKAFSFWPSLSKIFIIALVLKGLVFISFN